jgi:hypothetical protein
MPLKRKNLSVTYNKTIIQNRELEEIKEESWEKVKQNSDRRIRFVKEFNSS